MFTLSQTECVNNDIKVIHNKHKNCLSYGALHKILER